MSSRLREEGFAWSWAVSVLRPAVSEEMASCLADQAAALVIGDAPVSRGATTRGAASYAPAEVVGCGQRVVRSKKSGGRTNGHVASGVCEVVEHAPAGENGGTTRVTQGRGEGGKRSAGGSRILGFITGGCNGPGPRLSWRLRGRPRRCAVPAAEPRRYEDRCL